MSNQRRKGHSSSGDVGKEVGRLFAAQLGEDIPKHVVTQLRSKYKDDNFVEEVQIRFYEQRKEIRSKAKKFARLILDQYGASNYPLHIILKKAQKYKRKHGLSDAEFQEFRRIFEKHIMNLRTPSTHTQVQVVRPQTNMSKALGNASLEFQSNGSMDVKDDEYGHLQHILKLYSATRSTHSQVVLQSMTYTDLAFEAMTGKYDERYHNPANHVHPVVAALFLPKIQIFDDHMLIANLSHIVRSRYNKEPILTKPDYELFYDLVTDPNDIVCDASSPVKDLRDRCELQARLWESVLALRNGKYYEGSNADFLVAVDNCRASAFDAPDFMYINDDGTVLRRLLGAFSFRPTIVTTTSLYGMMTTGHMGHMGHAPIAPSVSSLPMVTVRLPYRSVKDTTPVRLEDGLEQAQWFMEDGNIVPKNQSIIYSRDVIIFYVPRRAHSLSIEAMTGPYNFNRLPAAISGFERINPNPVQFDNRIDIHGQTFDLRSVVMAEVNPSLPDFIIGSSAAVIAPTNLKTGVATPKYFHYDPRRAAVGVTADGKSYKRDKPITLLDPFMSSPGKAESFKEMATTRGTIWIYAAQDSDADFQGLIYY